MQRIICTGLPELQEVAVSCASQTLEQLDAAAPWPGPGQHLARSG